MWSWWYSLIQIPYSDSDKARYQRIYPSNIPYSLVYRHTYTPCPRKKRHISSERTKTSPSTSSLPQGRSRAVVFHLSWGATAAARNPASSALYLYLCVYTRTLPRLAMNKTVCTVVSGSVSWRVESINAHDSKRQHPGHKRSLFFFMLTASLVGALR